MPNRDAKPPITIETYRARWEDFRIDCDNLNEARHDLFHGYGNEDVGADGFELWDRVCEFEARHAHLSVLARADAIRSESYRYADM